MQQPTVYDHRNVYDNGAGGGDIDINDYFEFMPVYWDSSNNQFNALAMGNLSNTNLRIKGTFYSPNGTLKGSLFKINNGTYSNDSICIKYLNSSTFYINNGDYYAITPVNLTGVYEIDVYRNAFKIKDVDYTGGYVSTTQNAIFPLPLSASNNAYAEMNKSALIKLQLIDEQTNKILFDFRGARRKKDNAPCIIELANSTSVYNSNGFLKNYAMP